MHGIELQIAAHYQTCSACYCSVGRAQALAHLKQEVDNAVAAEQEFRVPPEPATPYLSGSDTPILERPQPIEVSSDGYTICNAANMGLQNLYGGGWLGSWFANLLGSPRQFGNDEAPVEEPESNGLRV